MLGLMLCSKLIVGWLTVDCKVQTVETDARADIVQQGDFWLAGCTVQTVQSVEAEADARADVRDVQQLKSRAGEIIKQLKQEYSKEEFMITNKHLEAVGLGCIQGNIHFLSPP